MTEQELQQRRKEKWRVDGHPARTLEDARSFIESVGFCLMYPLPAAEAKGLRLSVPTFVGAYVGDAAKLPTRQLAFRDPRAQEATELMVRLLRDRSAYEAPLFGETTLLVAASVFSYFYALVGDRTTKHDRSDRSLSPLAHDVLDAVQREGPVSKPRLREALGGEPSSAALDRALGELWSRLRITRVDYNPKDGAFWDLLYRWSPEAVNEGMHLSTVEALSALVSKYLDCVAAAEPQEVEDFLSSLAPRSKVKESVNALLASREVSFVKVGNRALLQVTPERTTVRPAARPKRRA
jgi:hypothetical protein